MFTFLRGKIFTFSCKKGYKSLLFTFKKVNNCKVKFVLRFITKKLLIIMVSFKKGTNHHEYFALKSNDLKPFLLEKRRFVPFFAEKSNDL